MADQDDVFRVLFVCTGNLCRSRIAEQVFRARFKTASVRFSSAGVSAMVGMGMPDQARLVSRNMGGVDDGSVAKQLTRDLVAKSDVVIALTRAHRSEIVRVLPRASRSTFTLRELARVLESGVADPQFGHVARSSSVPTDLRAFIPLVAAQRGYAPQPESPEDEDVIDPYRRSQAIYDLCEAQIEDAVMRIVASVSALSGATQ